MLSGKYNGLRYACMNKEIKNIARILGSRGGKARARNLSALKKKQIALLGAQARALSFETTKRIERNFCYNEAVRQLRGKAPKVLRLKICKNPLPKIQ